MPSPAKIDAHDPLDQLLLDIWFERKGLMGGWRKRGSAGTSGRGDNCYLKTRLKLCGKKELPYNCTRLVRCWQFLNA